MEFNPNTHKVIIDTLNKEEAKVFCKFLESEIIRHWQDIKQAHELIAIVKGKYDLP